MNTKRPLKIGITCYPTWGGSGVVATEIGMAMAERGHSVHFICYDVPRRLNRFSENVYFHEVEVKDSPLFEFPPYSLALASKMVEVVTYEQLDILHVHYAVPHATSAYLARQILKEHAPKIITTLHGTDITLVGNDRSYLPITRFSIAESDGVTAPSKFLRQATYDKLNLSSTVPIEVIANFVDIARFSPADGHRPGRLKQYLKCEKEKVLIHISNFRPVKRVDDVVKIFDLVRKELPAHLVLVGDGPERSKVEALVRELNISEKVTFLGKQESTSEILQASDLFLLPSKNESFGLAALEAMSCGLPVIASRAEGIPEVVLHEQTGFLSDVGDVEQMARYSVQLLKDSALYQKFSHAARNLTETSYNRDKLVSQYEDYYFSILG